MRVSLAQETKLKLASGAYAFGLYNFREEANEDEAIEKAFAATGILEAISK